MSYRQAIDAIFSGAPTRSLTGAEVAWLETLNVFAILYTNRSGSTLLADSLYSLGAPIPPQTEVWEAGQVRETVASEGHATFTDYFFSTVQGWTWNDQCGFKASAEQLEYMIELGYLQALKSFRCVLTTRGDQISQAVSLYLASETGRWHSNLRGRAADVDVPYSADGITAALDSVLAMEAANARFIALRQIPVQTVSFEALRDDRSAVLADVLEFLQLTPGSPRMGKIKPLEQQVSPTKADFVSRYRAQYAL